MKKLLDNFRSLPNKTKKLVGLGITLALVVALPLFIWAIVTQRFELRRFATSEPPPSTPSPNCVPRPKCADGITDENGRIVICDPPPGIQWCLPTPRPTPTCVPRPYCLDNPPYCRLDIPNVCPKPTPRPTPTCVPRPYCLDNPPYCRLDIPNVCPKPTPRPTPPGKNFQIKIKFSGVTDDSANGATATVRFVGVGIDRVTSPVIFEHEANGVYKASFAVTDWGIPFGDNYAIYIKGEKHLTRKFCQATGQTTRCTGEGNISIQPLPIPLLCPFPNCPPPPPPVYHFDFSGLSLEPGDLPSQDGQADANDFNKIKSRLSILCSNLSTDDRRTADLDYNGCVNIRDAFLMRKTLETKFDED